MPREPGSSPTPTERVVFFSDAVFAIAITLLVIDLRLPALVGPTDRDVLQALRDLAPSLFAYALSFAVIGLHWLAHVRRFRHIDHVDDRLTALNLLLLGFIAIVPFPTAVIGEHGDVPSSVVLYAVTLSAAGIIGTGSWLYAIRSGLVEPGLTGDYVRGQAARGLSVPVVMLGSLLFLPFVGPSPVELSWIAIVPVQAIIAARFRQPERARDR